ncbi:MAG: helix-turn-helix domain-containing protein, partial [Candidatus Acidiferrales bacterium]
VEQAKTAIVASVLISPDECAKILGTTEGVLAVWRSTGRYPLPYVRVGRKIRYKLSAVEDFIEQRTVGGTVEEPRRRKASRTQTHPC